MQTDQTHFVQGEQDADLFYLLSVNIELNSRGNPTARIRKNPGRKQSQNTCIGTEAVRHAIDQFSATQFIVKAISAAVVLRVSRYLLDRLMVIDPSAEPIDHWLADFLQTILMTRLPAASMRRVFSLLEILLVRTGDQVVADEIPCDYFYIVREGRCCVYYFNHWLDKRITLAELESGDYFGEEILRGGKKTLSSSEDAELWVITANGESRLRRFT